MRSIPQIEEQTGQRIASSHGGYQSVPPSVIIDAVQNDPRLSSDYPQPVPLSELPEVHFDVTIAR
jgi:hypothetical protein